MHTNKRMTKALIRLRLCCLQTPKKVIFASRPIYCKFGNFRENFTSANSVKRHICDAQSMIYMHQYNRLNWLFRGGPRENFRIYSINHNQQSQSRKNKLVGLLNKIKICFKTEYNSKNCHIPSL